MNTVFVIQHNDFAALSLPKTVQFLQQNPPTSGKIWRVAMADNVILPDDVCAELKAASCDFAVLPDYAFGQDVKLIVSDMDSTLITIECIDEIAAQAGLKPHVAEITERAMRGELDFEQSLRERVALLAGLPENVLQTVYDDVLQLNTGAEELLQQCHAHGIKFVLVSGGFTFFTDKLKQRLSFDDAFANVLEIENGVLTGRVLGRVIDAQAKADILRQFHAKTGGIAVAIGDGANDIPMLRAANVGIAFHAKAKAQAAADACINHGDLMALRGWFK